MSDPQAVLDESARRLLIAADFFEAVMRGGPTLEVDNGAGVDQPSYAKVVADLLAAVHLFGLPAKTEAEGRADAVDGALFAYLSSDTNVGVVIAQRDVGGASSTVQKSFPTTQYVLSVLTGLSDESAARAAAIGAEATVRSNADTTLQTNINAEATARAAAVSGEATARANADTALQTNINAEATARANADTSLQANKAEKSVTISGGGIATGGGDLSGNRTITVPKAGDTESDGGTDDATAMTPKQTRRQLDQRTKRAGNRNWITRWVGSDGKFAGGVRRSGALVALVGGSLIDIGARILSGEITAAAASAAADAKAVAADAKITARIPIRRSTDIWRLFDATKTKIALRVTRTGRFLALGRDVLAELDVLQSLRLRIATVNRRGVAALLRDEAGKSPMQITRTGRMRLLGRDVLAEIDKKANSDSIVVAPLIDLLLAGDSQTVTAGGQTPWRTQLVPLISARDFSLRAVGGTNSTQIAVACSALFCVVTLAGNQIPAGTSSVSITDIKIRDVTGNMVAFSPLNNQAANTRPFRLLGVDGVLTRNSDATAFTWARNVAGSAVYCPPDTPMVPIIGTDRKRTMIVAIGRNNLGAANDVDTVWRDMLAFESLQPYADKRQIWLPPTPASTEIEGSGNWLKIVELERRMTQRWGDRVVDIRQRSWQYGDGSSDDNADIENKTIPRSLTLNTPTDKLHYTTALHGHIAQWIAEIINRYGW